MNEKLESSKQKLETLKEKIKKEYKAEIVGIFGSYVRGEEKKESNLNILVKFEKGAILLNLISLAIYLEEIFSIKIDIVPVDTIREEIKDIVLKEAIYL